MTDLFSLLLPEIILTAIALVLMVMGMSKSAATRKAAPILAIVALAGAFFATMAQTSSLRAGELLADPYNVVRLGELGQYIKALTCGVGLLLVLLAWPTNDDASGNPSLRYGTEGAEFFGLMLLALTGVLLTASANDMVLLFLALEMASLPTYVMVSISRPLPVAQEAGVKYFFLGAMSAALMLFGFSYLYGTTGSHDLHGIMQELGAGEGFVKLNAWQLLAIVMVVLGLAFKIAAFPLHFYAGDVYQGAATPVTAFLAFVPKTTGFVALIKILAVAGGGAWMAPRSLATMLMIVAVLTMTVGNVLGLLQYNVKRVLAYSSIAHSGYMLVGLAALMYAAHNPELSASEQAAVQSDALKGVLFYLAAYGIMNAGSFGVLMLLPTREPAAASDAAAWAGTSAETFEDIAGTGRKHVGLGLAMAVSCLSLTGLPLTIGFFGKFYLIAPAWKAQLTALVIFTVINAAISAAYYLRIVAAMFLRPEPAPLTAGAQPAPAIAPAASTRLMPVPILASVVLSVVGTLLLGIWLPATNALGRRTQQAAVTDGVAAAAAPQAALGAEAP